MQEAFQGADTLHDGAGFQLPVSSAVELLHDSVECTRRDPPARALIARAATLQDQNRHTWCICGNRAAPSPLAGCS